MSVAVVILGWMIGVRLGSGLADTILDRLDSLRARRAASMRNVTPGRVA